MNLIARITDDGTRQLLADHVANVADASRRLAGRKQIEVSRLSHTEVSEVARIVGAAHDFGKGTTYFQRYIAPDGQYSGEEKNHASLSAYFAYYWLQQAKFNDEIALLGWYVVQRHHGNLTNLFEEGGELHRKADDPHHRSVLEKQAEDIATHTGHALADAYRPLSASEYVDEFLEEMQQGTLVDQLVHHRFHLRSQYEQEDYYLVLFLYSILLDADKTDSAGISFGDWPSVGLDTLPEIDASAVDEYKSAVLSITSELDRQREAAYNYVDERIKTGTVNDEQLLSLTMPTGSGKTLTALNAALQRRETDSLPRPSRIIYSVPFLSIIDQNHGVYERVLEENGIPASPNVLLRHDHTATGYADGSFSTNTDINKELLKNPDRSLLLTEGWNAEVVTTTFVQFFETILTRRNGNARRFHKLANAIVLLDEIQAVPTKYWGPIRAALQQLSDVFNATIILMTATNPLLFDEGEITELTDNSEGVSQEPPTFDQFNRVTFELELPSVSLDELATNVTERLDEAPNEDVMVVLNTVHASREVFSQLDDAVDRQMMYLSTNVLPRHRTSRIRRINDTDEPLLLVTTQLVEAGVDIDFDTVYRDFAPIDSLVQTAGRCNREGAKDRGLLKVFKLRDDRENAPRKYHYQYVYDTVLTTATEEVLADHPRTVSEAEFNASATTAYFEKVNDRKATDSEGLLPAMESLSADKIDPRLVQTDYRTVPVYVLADDEAQTAYDDMEEVYDQYEEFARRGELETRKAPFYANVVNVSIPGDEDELAHLPMTFIDEIRLVTPDKIGPSPSRDWYDPETGFRIPDRTINTRIV
jgi:CRISPR-associated endonuclease/helicase Cas3